MVQERRDRKPQLEFVTRLEGRFEGTNAKAKFKVPEEGAGDDVEYVFISRVPDNWIHNRSDAPALKVDGSDSLDVTIGVDPDLPESADDKFTLSADDGSYKTTKSVRDDTTPGDRTTTLKFEGLTPGKTYSLLVETGGGAEPYYLFQGQPFGGSGKGK